MLKKYSQGRVRILWIALAALAVLATLWLVFSHPSQAPSQEGSSACSGSEDSALSQTTQTPDASPHPISQDPASRQALLNSPQALELTNQMRARYGPDVTLETIESSLYTFQKTISRPTEGTFLFQAELSPNPQVEPADNYMAELFYFLGNTFVSSGNLTIQWEETGSGVSRQYTPVFSSYGRSAYMMEAFCGNVCDFVEYCMQNYDFSRNPQLLSKIQVEYGTERASFEAFQMDSYERVDFYNALYAFMDDFTLRAYTALAKTRGSEKEPALDPGDAASSADPEVLAAWLKLEADCSFQSPQGMEYRMVGVDRAAGSSYYVLLGTWDQGRTCSFLNPDPYNGSGGAAKWLSFLDESLGFSCLAYSGGSYGSLYRTEDGGRTFTEIEYPSPKITLSNGSYYNPFVMPEKVYEENGQLYLVAGQGPEGDYYGENGRCSGLYCSGDRGETWTYVGEAPANDTPT